MSCFQKNIITLDDVVKIMGYNLTRDDKELANELLGFRDIPEIESSWSKLQIPRALKEYKELNISLLDDYVPPMITHQKYKWLTYQPLKYFTTQDGIKGELICKCPYSQLLNDDISVYDIELAYRMGMVGDEAPITHLMVWTPGDYFIKQYTPETMINEKQSLMDLWRDEILPRVTSFFENTYYPLSENIE